MATPETPKSRAHKIKSIDQTDSRCQHLLRLLQKGNSSENINEIAETLVDIYCMVLRVEKKRSYKFVLTIDYGKAIRTMILQLQTYSGYEMGPSRFFLDFKLDESSSDFFRISYVRDVRTLEDNLVISFFREERGVESEDAPYYGGGDRRAEGYSPAIVSTRRNTGDAVDEARRHSGIKASRANVEAQKTAAERATAATRQAIKDRELAATAAANVVAERKESGSVSLINRVRDAIQTGNRDLVYNELDELNLFLMTGMPGRRVDPSQKRFISLMGRKFVIMRDLEKFFTELGFVMQGKKSAARVKIPLGGGGKSELLLEFCNDRLNILLTGEASDAVRGRYESLSGGE